MKIATLLDVTFSSPGTGDPLVFIDGTPAIYTTLEHAEEVRDYMQEQHPFNKYAIVESNILHKE